MIKSFGEFAGLSEVKEASWQSMLKQAGFTVKKKGSYDIVTYEDRTVTVKPLGSQYSITGQDGKGINSENNDVSITKGVYNLVIGYYRDNDAETFEKLGDAFQEVKHKYGF